MDFSLSFRFMWIVGAVFVILPRSNVGLLSDYKICGDSECESLMGRAKAVKDHNGKDCRFLSFRRGNIIFVYHKLTGKREDLWAGSIDKQFGYFPRDAVQEEQVYATTEIVVKTQKSDFFCMDESGYPIDTTYLDDDDVRDDNEKVQTQESETIQINPNAPDTNADSPSTSANASTEGEAQEAEEENKNLSDAAEAHEEAHKASATQKEQGGSPSSSSWLGSSMTWLGLSKEEQSGNLEEYAREAESKDTHTASSLTSSVTGWLGFEGDGKSDDVEESVKLKEESYASAMTGWLGFGGETKAATEKNEQNGEQGTEPVETFRSRRMSLDLEGSELHEEEKIEMGTLGWLGSGLSSRLGFGQNKHDPGEETKHGGEAEEKKEREASGSWMDMGFGGILGYGNDNTDDNDKDGSIEDIRKDKSLEQTAESENLETDGSRAPLTGEVKTEKGKETQAEEPASIPSTEPGRADSNNNNIIDDNVDNSDRRESNIIDVEAGLKVEHKDVSPQAVVEMSSSVNGFSQTDEKEYNNLENNKTDKGDVYQMHDSTGNVRESDTREPAVNEMNTTSNIKDLITQSESRLGPDHSFGETVSKSMEQSEGREEDANLDESNDVSVKDEFRGSDDEEELSKETNSSHEEMFTTPTEESQIGEDAEESKEQNQLHSSLLEGENEHISAEEGFSPSIAEANAASSTTPAITDDNVEAESDHEELGLEGSHQDIGSLHSVSKNLYEDEDRELILTNIPNISHPPGSPQMEEKVPKSLSDVDNLKETLEDKKEETEKETTDFEEEVLNEKSTLSPETEIEEGGKKITTEGKEEEKQQEVNEVKEEERQVGAEDRSEMEKKNLDRKFEEKEKEKKKDVNEEENEESEMEETEEVMEVNKEEQQEVEELTKEEKNVSELIEQENEARVERLKESEEKREEGKQMQDGSMRPVVESNKKETLDDNSLALSFTETTKQTESRKVEEEKREEKEEEEEEEEFEKGEEEKTEEGIAEKQQIKDVENDQPECSDLNCPKDGTEEAVEVGDGPGSEDGASSADAAAAWMAEDKIEERETKVPEDSNDVSEEQILKTDGTTLGSESNYYERAERSARVYDSVESQIPASERTESEAPAESSHPPGATESESRGAFGLFKNTFGFFSQTPTAASTGPTQSTQSINSNTAEPSQSQVSEPELASTTDPVLPSEQPHPTSTENIHLTAPLTTETPSKTNPLTKHYKNLLIHMSGDETAVLLELFGRHKLQFLDYVLASSEAVTTSADQSILSDIKRLLDHHGERLVAPHTRLTDTPQEDKEKTRTFIALQKLEMLLKTIKVTFSTGVSDVSKHQDESSCATCSTRGKGKKDDHRDEQTTAGSGPENEKKYVDEERRDRGGREEGASLPYAQPESQNKGLVKQTLDFILWGIEDSNKDILTWFKVVSSLPDDMRPGPDLYGVPWEPVIVTGLVVLVTFLLFTCRCYRSIKSRMYRSKERWMAQQITQLLDEKCKVLETLSQCQQEYDELENSLRDGGVLAQTQKTKQLEVQVRQLKDTKEEFGRDLDHLKAQLEQQREHRKEQERRISELEESIKTFEQETKDLQSQDEQAQTTLKIYNMNSDRLQGNLETAREENTVLQESNTQLKQQVEGWAERVSELEAEMQRCEVAHSVMVQDVANKDERITSLTDRLLRMKGWDSDLEEEGGEEGDETTNGTPRKGDESGRGDLTDTHLQKVQKLIYAAKLNADLKSVDEDKDRAFAKLNDEIKAKEHLQVSIKELENEKLALQSDSKHYSDEVERLQQKLQIMTEMYQENELKLHRMLTVEEKERLQKEEKLNKADKNIAMALEELNNYRKRAEEMEEELEKTKQSYQTQISSHETKAHNNWLAARAAERDLGDIRRENSLLRQKITDTQFKLDSLDKDPYALNSLARPLPFRAERSPYGPSPLSRPSSETRPFLSPPTLMDGPPARLSPRGYMFPEPGAPMFRRPPPPPAALGLLPPPGSLPPGPLQPRGLPPGPPHPADMTDGSFRENRLGPGDQDLRLSGPGDQRTPPESDLRMGGPPPGPPMVPMDGPFPRRAPYGPPPPPDFYPPRGPRAPPMMPMWPPPPGMMVPPRLPPGGPLLPPGPHPNMPPYGPPPPQQSLPSPPHSQSPEENRPSPEDVI
ncbi:melanoma inhibitory activity protein 2 isoform X3 [Kryptolebias marmoratus]|nr:melanoma inhibitory activity protein 2 isoform X3 [Kryptolebias marmoratus]